MRWATMPASSSAGAIGFRPAARAPLISVVIGEYLGVLFPSLAGKTVALAFVIVIAFAVMQWRGIRWGSAVQNITSLAKALAFVALVIACFALGGKNHGSRVKPRKKRPAVRKPLFIGFIPRAASSDLHL